MLVMTTASGIQLGELALKTVWKAISGSVLTCFLCTGLINTHKQDYVQEHVTILVKNSASHNNYEVLQKPFSRENFFNSVSGSKPSGQTTPMCPLYAL